MLLPDLGFLVEVALALVLVLVPMWWAIIDVAKRPRADLARLTLPRYAWILLILVVGPLAALFYLVYARIKLRQPQHAAA
jgi:hypothetical protein